MTMFNPMLDRDGNLSTAGFNERQKGVMDGFDWAIEALENLRDGDYADIDGAGLKERLENEMTRKVIDECVERLRMEAIEMCTVYQDENYDEEAGKAQGDRPMMETGIARASGHAHEMDGLFSGTMGAKMASGGDPNAD